MTTATADEALSGEIALRPASAVVEEYRPRIVMAPEDAKALDQALRENMKAVLHDGVDYGVIPGTGNKPTLLKPGAEKLLQWFGFGHTMEQVETERGPEGQWLGVTYRCTVTKAMPDGRVVTVGTCEGYAGYDEERFYQTAEQAEAKERALAKRYKRDPYESKFAEYRAPRNSVVKMAQKRALVGAALQATSASTLFTQDVEDGSTTDGAAPVVLFPDAVATDAIMALPAEPRKALDRWCRERGWGRRADWDSEQWCTALVQAGRLDARHSLASKIADASPGHADTIKAGLADLMDAPAEDAWTTPEGGDDWVQKAVEQAAALTSKDAGRTLYQQAVAKEQAGEITKAQKDEVCSLITAQMEFLASQQPVEGAVSAPDGDSWQGDIDAMTTREDAIPLLDKLEKARKGGIVDSRRYAALKAAIRTKANGLPSAPGTAA